MRQEARDFSRESKFTGMLTPTGKFVFAVDTVANKSVDTINDKKPDESDYRPSITVKTKDGFKTVIVYSTFQKELATGNQNEMFLYECLL